MNKGNIYAIIGIALFICALFFAMWYFSRPVSPYGNLDAFAQCIADKKITMYGAYWCSHCKDEKARFGDSFKYIPYVECTEETQKCISAGIEGYPTWILPDGTKLVGEQGLEKLSEASGCALPPKK
ncbi:MAG: hypothetical protein Q7R98_00750 [Candidatus Jorgensenbacteria bacterium]|nr:hypothetical protein [Candidatus Jorgensenbacteria bacterium]